ncbi:hypothetical protein [Haloarcula salinisoli]|uniref:Uncharacterized protein n=1 Tax=Haloarcula salinisoli TaxID=2487746 RepID=A0A8J7YB93_9EURY|nr:hypothetical protein [Halomicroarcula salinisoli]MBX0286225.1 hypothetical protein [Halomicroarcula salinisoli]MBX0302287.1 hypothetical protein [Halomicroarcula salinisoli]
MSHRRTLLSSLALGAIGLAGCSSLRGHRGYIYLKHIQGQQEPNEEFEDVLVAARDDENGGRQGSVADRWEEYVDNPKAPTVSESFHETLHREYHEVAYLARFCSEQLDSGSYGCIKDDVDREDFNQAQVYDRVQARHLDEQDRIEIYSVVESWTPTDST